MAEPPRNGWPHLIAYTANIDAVEPAEEPLTTQIRSRSNLSSGPVHNRVTHACFGRLICPRAGLRRCPALLAKSC